MNKPNDGTVLVILIVYVITVFIPMEAFFLIGPLRMEPYRLVLLLVCLISLKNLKPTKGDQPAKYLLMYCMAAFVSFIYVHGMRGIQSSIILFLEVYISYALGMLVFGRKELFAKVLSAILFVFFLLAPFAIVESADGYRFFHVITAELFDNYTMETLGESYYRHGLYRASTVFSHPILYSVIAVMLFPLLYLFRSHVIKLMFSIGILVAMITSVTSAGILMMVSQVGLFACKILERNIPNIFKYVVWVVISFYVVATLASNRGPVLVLIQSLALNSQTAYSRYMQWMFSADDIARNPLFGIGFNEWTRPFWMHISIDSFWLMAVLQNGYLALIPLSLCFIYSMKGYWSLWRGTNDTLYFCFFLSMFSIVFAGFTVDFFDRAQLMVFFFLGVFNSFIESYKYQSRLEASI
jgi:hypothetical protein